MDNQNINPIKTNVVNDPLLNFRMFQIIIAMLCMVIPAILRLYDDDTIYPKNPKPNWQDAHRASCESFKSNSIKCVDGVLIIKKYIGGFRESISNYAYTTNSYIFGMLFCMAAMLFIYNGVVYYNNKHHFNVSKYGQWYYVVLGIALLGVVCFPHLDWPIMHYVFAVIFFVGNALVIFLFYDKSENSILQKILRKAMGIATIAFLVVPLLLSKYHPLNKYNITTLWGEWLSLSVIGVHVILEAYSANGAKWKNSSKNPNKIKLYASLP